ncbi:MAG: metal-binding protein, partial [Deltaproteobacteria bacterium]|nr:metal-binding protein [Deltaproteobacteria bacterium]
MAEKKEPKCALCGINILEKICMNPQGKGPDFCPT